MNVEDVREAATLQTAPSQQLAMASREILKESSSIKR